MKPNPYLDEPSPTLRQPRGQILSAWLLFLTAANGFALVRGFNTSNLMAIGWALFGLVCVFGVFRWQKWAYFASYIGFMFNIAAALDTAARGDTSGGLFAILFQFTYMALMYALVHHRLNEFS